MQLPITPLLPRARRSATIAENLRHLITSGQLRPGDKLPTESSLCQKFGVSRTTLREAIQMLRTNGLLDVTPGRGSFVRVPDLRQLMSNIALTMRGGQIPGQEIRALRLLLQRDMLPRVVRHPANRKKDLYQHVLIRAAAPEDNAQLEANWHLYMADLAGNSMQKMVLEMLLMMDVDTRVRRYRDPDAVMHAIHVQMRTNTAIMDGDQTLAERVLSQFIDPAPANGAATPGGAPLPGSAQAAGNW